MPNVYSYGHTVGIYGGSRLKKQSIGILMLPRHYPICLEVIQTKWTQTNDSTPHFLL